MAKLVPAADGGSVCSLPGRKRGDYKRCDHVKPPVWVEGGRSFTLKNVFYYD